IVPLWLLGVCSAFIGIDGSPSLVFAATEAHIEEAHIEEAHIEEAHIEEDSSVASPVSADGVSINKSSFFTLIGFHQRLDRDASGNQYNVDSPLSFLVGWERRIYGLQLEIDNFTSESGF